MFERNRHIAQLLYKHLFEKLSDKEKDELQQWLDASEENRKLFENLGKGEWLKAQYSLYDSIDVEQAFEQFNNNLGKDKKKSKAAIKIFNYFKYTVAAACLIYLICVGYQIASSKNSALSFVKKLPPIDEAIIRLNDGSSYTIAAASRKLHYNGCTMLLREGPYRFRLLDDGSCGSEGDASGMANNLSTETNATSAITFAEGSTARINGSSSLNFPIRFVSYERKVELKGEGNFDIHPVKEYTDQSKVPFSVVVRPSEIMKYAFRDSSLTITAHGTNFTVRAYDKDSVVRAALFSGSLTILRKGSNKPVMLEPGQVYELHADGKEKVGKIAEMPETGSWTNGIFDFEKEPVDSVLQELGRWYNVVLLNPDHIDQRVSFNCRRSLPFIDVFDNVASVLSAHYERHTSDTIILRR